MINYKSYKASCSKGTDSKPFLFVIFYITVVSNAHLFNVPCFHSIFKEEHTMLEDMKKNLNLTFTENGAVTNGTTGSDCLDLFSGIGAFRYKSDGEIIKSFIKAFTENPDMAMKILFFGRDVREGLGERKVFRTIISWLGNNEPKSIIKNIEYIAEYGRYDDLLSLLDTKCEKEVISFLKVQFDKDIDAMNSGKAVSLLGKWLPSVNASNKETVKTGKRIAKAFNLTDEKYRKSLSALRAKIKIIENNLREKDYTFDYKKQPSRALFKYRMAFMNNDNERYSEFLANVSNGKAKLNTNNIYPYELIEPYLSTSFLHNEQITFTEAEKETLNVTWTSFPDFCNDEDTLAVIDTSGSMYCCSKPTPASVALSLGLYFAEHNKGKFKNHFIEFSNKPQLIEIKGETFADRLRYISQFNEIANTNIEAVFNLILDTAVKGNYSQEDLPKKLILISDMEFDYCVENANETNFNNAKKNFEEKGYKLPNIIFWNVASRNSNQPVTKNEQGVALVSGVTPRLFSMVASGELSPYKFMIETISNKRYAKIVA